MFYVVHFLYFMFYEHFANYVPAQMHMETGLHISQLSSMQHGAQQPGS